MLHDYGKKLWIGNPGSCFWDARNCCSGQWVHLSIFCQCFLQAMLAILIGLLTILTWHFTRSYTKKSLDTLASGLRYEILQRPILRMWNVLNSTAEITAAQVKLSEYVIRRYSKPANQAEQVEVVVSMMISKFCHNLIIKLFSGLFWTAVVNLSFFLCFFNSCMKWWGI